MSRHRYRRPLARRALTAVGVVLLAAAAVLAAGTVAPSSSLTISPSSSPPPGPMPGAGCPDGFTRYHGTADSRLACVRPISFPTPTR